MSSAPPSFACGHGSADDWREAIGICLDQIDEGPEMRGPGFVYLSDHFAGAAADILTVLRGRTGINDWVGTVGIGIAATATQYFDTPAVSVMIADLPGDAYDLIRGGADEPGGSAFDTWFGVMHGNPQSENLPADIQRFAERQGGFWVGGLTASRGAGPAFARGLTDGPVSGIALSEKTGVLTALTQGCTPIGPTHEITRSEANLIVELDGRPAFEVFKEEIGELLARNLNRIPGFIFAGLPVSGADTDDYLVRDIAGLDPNQGIVAIAAEAETGRRVMFCRRDAGSAEADMTRMLDKLEARLDGRTPRGGLYYSCLGRGPGMFDEARNEPALIAERFGDMPLTGFFCNGEISNARLYTYTGVLSLFV